MIELKPCPLCGGKAVLYADNGVCVICKRCGAQTQTMHDCVDAHIIVYTVCDGAVEAVIGRWNRRTTDEQTHKTED